MNQGCYISRFNQHALYNRVAAAIFKEQYKPADPFEGVLIDATYLEVSELVTIYKGALALQNEGNNAFIKDLIEKRPNHKTPLVRVNVLWLNVLWLHILGQRKGKNVLDDQRKGKICEYLEKACFEFNSIEEVVFYEQEIEEMNDPQLLEYLQQAREALKDEGLEIDAYAGEAVLDRYVDPEELGRE